MSSFIELEQQDQARSLKHTSLKSLERVGEVQTRDLPAIEPADPSDVFDIEAHAGSFYEDEHGDEPCGDSTCACHTDCELNACETCFEKAIDDGERAYDAWMDEQMGI